LALPQLLSNFCQLLLVLRSHALPFSLGSCLILLSPAQAVLALAHLLLRLLLCCLRLPVGLASLLQLVLPLLLSMRAQAQRNSQPLPCVLYVAYVPAEHATHAW
jgi:hypothetical protein